MDKKYKVMEQLGEPYSAPGKSWVRTTYKFEDVETKETQISDTFHKNLKVGEIYEGEILLPENPMWNKRFNLKKREYTGGGKDQGAINENAKLKRELSVRQTCLNCSVDILTSIIPLATLTKEGKFKIGTNSFTISGLIEKYFNMFLEILMPGQTKVDVIKKVFDGEEMTPTPMEVPVEPTESQPKGTEGEK